MISFLNWCFLDVSSQKYEMILITIRAFVSIFSKAESQNDILMMTNPPLLNKYFEKLVTNSNTLL